MYSPIWIEQFSSLVLIAANSIVGVQMELAQEKLLFQQGFLPVKCYTHAWSCTL